MSSALRILLLVGAVLLALLVAHGLARAHLAQGGWRYDYACCGDMDCAEVAPPRVTPAGLVFAIRRGAHPAVRERDITILVEASDLRIHPSGDGAWHLCLGVHDQRLICVYRPAAGF